MIIKLTRNQPTVQTLAKLDAYFPKSTIMRKAIYDIIVNYLQILKRKEIKLDYF